MADPKVMLTEMKRIQRTPAGSLICPCYGKDCNECCPCKKFGSCSDCVDYHIDHPKKDELDLLVMALQNEITDQTILVLVQDHVNKIKAQRKAGC